MPADSYTSSDRHEEELDVLFLGQPLVLCLSGSLPGPGNYHTVDLCGDPILLTRDNDDQVHALANVCRHRGVRVVDGAGETRRFTCPFHAWCTTSRAGWSGVPVASAFEGMCREDKGLVELPVTRARHHAVLIGRRLCRRCLLER